jgi:hypothetical protein
MKKTILPLFLSTCFILNAVFIPPLFAVDVKINGDIRLTDYLYDELDRYYGPPAKRANYLLQQTTLNTAVKAVMTTGVVQLYLNNLDLNNQPTGGYIWGSTGGTGSNIPLDPFIHQAYLEIPVPGGMISGGRRLVKVGHGIILNDTSDNLFLNVPFSIFNLDLAYLKLVEPDSSLHGNLDDFDTNGYVVKLNTKFNETDSLELFYAEFKQANPIGLIISDNKALAVGIAGGGKAGAVDWTGELDQITGNDGDYRVNLPRYGINAYLSGSTKLNFGRVGIDILQVKGKRSSDEVSYNSLAGDFVGGQGILFNDQTRFGGGIDLNSGMVDMADPTSVGYWHFISHNFTSLKGFVDLNPYKKISLTMEIFPYLKLNDTEVLIINGLAVTNQNIGMEGNIRGTYPIDNNLKLSAVLAYFKAGDLLKEIASLDHTPSFAQNIVKTSLSLAWIF